MTSSMLVWLACCCLAGTTTAPALRDLPPEWPPLPDFHRPVDYVKWLQDRLSVPPNEDARPFYDQLFEHPDDHPLVKQVKRWMWGAGEREGIDGLFTGDAPTPDRYAWEPRHHPTWERAYQHQIESGLSGVLDVLCKFRGLSAQVWWTDPAKAWDSRIYKGSLREKPKDFGLTTDDRLIYTARLHSYRGARLTAQTLLQNAWRAPGGRVDADEMLKAIENTFRIINQVREVMLSGFFVNMGVRVFIYRNAAQALQEAALPTSHIEKVLLILQSLDNQDHSLGYWDRCELLGCFDLLQFLYNANSSGRVLPDLNRLRRLTTHLQLEHAWSPELCDPPLDLAGQIDRSSADSGVRQAVELFLEIRRLTRTMRPPQAETAIQDLLTRFRQNDTKHVVVRQSVSPFLGRAATLLARSETERRATHLLFAMHIYRLRNNQWPTTLAALPGLSQECRIDPFSGKEFCYRNEGDHLLLYSVAANGHDDGGVHDRWWGEVRTKLQDRPAYSDTDYVFWPVQKEHW